MFNHPDSFVNRHLGPSESEQEYMLKTLGLSNMEELISQTIPATIRLTKPLRQQESMSEYDYMQRLKNIAAKNTVAKSYIGLGYYDCITPPVILRNIFENPGWYTQYTPYQAEISQGRLEALLNFQTMISDLTGLPVANASLLDEATAAAEAMTMIFGQKQKKDRKSNAQVLLVDDQCFPQTIEVVKTRAEAVGIEVKLSRPIDFVIDETVFGALVQYPGRTGEICDYQGLADQLHEQDSYLIVAADIMALALLKAPATFGADVVVGSAQRFGVPMGFGGPHAAYFATKEDFLRMIPGRIIGVSIDSHGKPAMRMTLQTREQHIRRDKATSNICTAQALLAIMAGMYAVYHGPEGIKGIALRIHRMTMLLQKGLEQIGIKSLHTQFFDTLAFQIEDTDALSRIREQSEAAHMNFSYQLDNYLVISLDETTNEHDVRQIIGLVSTALGHSPNGFEPLKLITESDISIPESLRRKSDFLTHEVFNSYHSETAMMRYIKQLENKDLSLNTAMIPLGSCTMKLNAASELIPVSWPEFARIHPFAPKVRQQHMIRLSPNWEPIFVI